jgi:hypothetical protein
MNGSTKMKSGAPPRATPDRRGPRRTNDNNGFGPSLISAACCGSAAKRRRIGAYADRFRPGGFGLVLRRGLDGEVRGAGGWDWVGSNWAGGSVAETDCEAGGPVEGSAGESRLGATGGAVSHAAAASTPRTIEATIRKRMNLAKAVGRRRRDRRREGGALERPEGRGEAFRPGLRSTTSRQVGRRRRECSNCECEAVARGTLRAGRSTPAVGAEEGWIVGNRGAIDPSAADGEGRAGLSPNPVRDGGSKPSGVCRRGGRGSGGALGGGWFACRRDGVRSGRRSGGAWTDAFTDSLKRATAALNEWTVALNDSTSWANNPID